MKINLFCFFLLFPTLIKSQNLDTIFYNDDGYYRVIEKNSYDEITKPSLIVEEFREYTIAKNTLIARRQVLGENQILTQLWRDNGKKYHEEYIDNSSESGYQIIWDEEGNKKYQLIKSDSETIKISYNKLNSIKELIKIHPYSYQFDSICVFDRKVATYWVEQPIINKKEYLQRKNIEFYDNGNIKSEKFFINKKFIAFTSKEEYLAYLKTGDKSMVLKKEFEVKSGTWKFYNRKGMILSEEHFDVHKKTLKAIGKI